MGSRSSRFSSLLYVLVALVLILDFARIITQTARPDGGHDLHPYWYYGHMLRQGGDPYRAFLTGKSPQLPVRYLDGVVTTEPPLAQPGLPGAPTNTAPLSLLLYSSSLVSWPLAKTIWMFSNLGLILLLPLLVIRAFPCHESFTHNERLVIALIVYGFGSTRGSVEIGQTTLLVFSLMLGSFLFRKRCWPVSGFLLGVALGKYSIALPILLFLLLEFRRANILIIGTALLVQVIGSLPITLISGNPPLQIVQDYVGIMQHMSATHQRQGIQLSILFPAGSRLATVATILVTVFLLGVIVLWWRRRRSLIEDARLLADYHLFCLFLLWASLTIYTGGYDLLILLSLVPLLLFAGRHPALWRLSKRQGWLLIGLLVLLVGAMSVPYRVLNSLCLHRPDLALMQQFEQVYVLILLFLLLTLSWLLMRVRSEDHVSSQRDGG